MKRSIVIPILIFILDCLTLNAAAGFVDTFNERQHWIYPAYLYNLIFGGCALVSLWICTIVWKTKCTTAIEKISTYLRSHPIVAIISCGLLLSIPLGLCIELLWEVLWFISLLPSFGLMLLFPFILSCKKSREKWILSTGALKWLILFVMACCISSLLFIILTNAGILPNTNITHTVRLDRIHPTFYILTHPYDSMKEIWSPSLIFIAEVIVAIVFYFIGKLNTYLRHNISTIRLRKRETLSDK